MVNGLWSSGPSPAPFPMKEKYPQVHEWFFGPMMQIESFKKLHDEAVNKLGYIVKNVDTLKAKRAKM